MLNKNVKSKELAELYICDSQSSIDLHQGQFILWHKHLRKILYSYFENNKNIWVRLWFGLKLKLDFELDLDIGVELGLK